MPAYKADALVLRTYRYGEADQIVVFLTADRGKKRGVAKNATKSRRRFGGALEPLTRGTVAYVEREHRELVRLDRIDPVTSPLSAVGRSGPGDSAHALGHAAYFAELLDEWAPDGHANERLFRLGAAMNEALVVVGGGGGSVEAVARYFEYWLLRLEGVYPAFESLRLSPGAIAFLTAAMTAAPADVAAAAPDRTVLREIETVHHRLIAMHLEKEVRSARVVRELRPE
jgi:DNA repair protein RecO (recombination protein O)